jgi:hypothetical protein
MQRRTSAAPGEPGVARERLSAIGALAAGGAALALATFARNAAAGDDVTTLNTLLTAEYDAIDAYGAGAGILMSPPANDPLASAAPVVLAVALHFQSQHQDHAKLLASTIQAQAGTPVDPSSGKFSAPAGFTGSVLDVVRLASNAEKAAAIAYNDAVKAVSSAANAQLLAAIGGNEAQHFILLSLVAQGVAGPTMTTKSDAADFVPEAFVAAVGTGTTGLEAIPDFSFS